MTAQRKPTRKQELVSAISTQGAHLSLSKNTINSLARYATKASDQRVAELLDLISQPDPHNSLRHALPPRIRDAQADWDDMTEEDFSQWVANAALCYHKVDAYLNQNSLYHRNNPETDRLTPRFIQGMDHYRDSNPGYTDEQLTDLAMIAAAVHVAYFNELDRTQTTPLDDIGNGRCTHSWCHHIANHTIVKLATTDHETAMRIFNIITDECLTLEAHVLHRLSNAPRALINGNL